MSPGVLAELLAAPALPAPEGVTPDFDNPPNKNGLAWFVTTFCMVVATMCLFLRIIVRLWLEKKLRVEECKLTSIPLHLRAVEHIANSNSFQSWSFLHTYVVFLEACFYADQAFWKDQLALTYHLRTFKTPGVIAASLLETEKPRSISKGIAVDGVALFLPATPVLVSECRIGTQ